MYLFWSLWSIDALVALIIIVFFLIGLSDGSVSSFNIVLWLVILIGLAAVLLGSYWLFMHQYPIVAQLLLASLAIPSLLYGLLMLLMLGNTNWK